MLVGGEGHPVSEAGDTAGRYNRLAAFARDRLGVNNVAYRWSTQDNMPVDGLPYVGLMSAHGAHHVAQINQIAANDFRGEARTWQAMRQHMLVIADSIADALQAVPRSTPSLDDMIETTFTHCRQPSAIT